MPPLILTAPAASGIRTYRNGVKVIRLHEFLGPARGTLTTESDPWSLCGTVVRDTQTVSYDIGDSIIANIKTSAADTIRISKDDLNLHSWFDYKFYISARSEGEIDETKQNITHNFLEIGLNSSAIVPYTRNAALTEIFELSGVSNYAPKELTNPYYKVIDCDGLINNDSLSTHEYLVLRAATGTGGTFEWILDCLYLVPFGARIVDGNPYVDLDFRKISADLNFDPLYFRDTDTFDDDGDSVEIDWVGRYSVMVNAPSGFSTGNITHADYQEGNNEKSLPRIDGDGASPNFKNPDPSSNLTIVTGSHYTPSHEVDTDSFTRTTTAFGYLGASDQNRAWSVIENADGSGHRCDGSKLVLGPSKSGAAFPFQWPTTVRTGSPNMVQLGSDQNEEGAGGTSVKHQVLTGMNHCIMEAKVTTDHILVAGFQMMLGFCNLFANEFIGVVLDIPPGEYLNPSEVLNCGLMYMPTPTSDTYSQDIWIDGDGTTNLTNSYTANTWVRMKIEMNWYYFKGKAWMDGDTEPDWMWEGQIPSTDVSGEHLYPWTTDIDIAQDRRSYLGLYPTLVGRYFNPWEDTTGDEAEFTIHPTRTTETYFDDLVIDYDAYGSDPTDVHMKMTSYDDVVDFGTVTMTPESQRIVISPTAPHGWNDDEDGVSITLWKNSGAPDTQATVLSDIWQRRIRGGPIWLNIRLRPFEINEVD